MRGTWRGWVTVAIALGLTGSGWSAEPDNPKKSSWLPGWLSFAKKAEEKPAPAQTLRIDPALLRDKEKADHFRRVEVCNRLREIAYQTKDLDLERKANHLEQRAFDLYLQRLGQLSGTRFESDEQILERRLGTEASVRPSGPGSANTGRSRGTGRAAVRED